jgi:hypothetical protein
MPRGIRYLGLCLAFALLASSAEAASVTLAWDPNSEPDLARYYVGYRTSPSGSETLVNVGNVTQWTLTTANPGSTYYFRVYAENTSGLRSAPSTEVSTTIPTTPPPPTGGGLTLERSALNFGGVQSSGNTLGAKTPAQRMMVTQTAAGSALSWTAASTGTGSSRITVSPTSGSGTGPITVTFASTSLAAGTYTNNVRITVGSTQLNVPITTVVYSPSTSAAPAGSFDTPADGTANISGAIPVTGWAIDDVAVSRIDIYRDPVAGEAGLVFLGNGSIIAGSRPDVEGLYPQRPLNYRTGWGFMVLTNMLPNQATGQAVGGNGTFRLHAYAIDAEARATYLGAKTIGVNNAAATKPFGTLDTPPQGGTISGSAYTVFGWALSPRGTIPTNGSTINVYIDGVMVGHPVYNNNRSDIASFFPGYANSNGAVGYYTLNTTQLSNGTHTIAWTVTDNLGNVEGIGSRFFTVQNGSGALTSNVVETSNMSIASHGAAVGESIETMAEVPAEYSMVEVKKPASDEQAQEVVYPEWTGKIRVRVREAEQVELKLASQFDDSPATYEGYVVVGGRMRPLPVGSTLNTTTGVFSWQPGPGFIGRYEFVFLRTSGWGIKTRIPVDVRILQRHDAGEGR